MNRLLQIGLGLALVGVGVAGGYLYRDKQRDPVLQDYALASLQSDLIYVAKLDATKAEEVRQLLDIRIFDDVTHARESDTANAEPEFLKARMRILAGIAALWNAAPPPDSKLAVGARDQPWFKDWMTMYEVNSKFVFEAEAASKASNCSPTYRTRVVDPKTTEGGGATKGQ